MLNIEGEIEFIFLVISIFFNTFVFIILYRSGNMYYWLILYELIID